MEKAYNYIEVRGRWSLISSLTWPFVTFPEGLMWLCVEDFNGVITLVVHVAKDTSWCVQ